MSSIMYRLALLASAVACFLTESCFAQTQRSDGLEVARAYADAMLQHARDRYGKNHTPMFAATLDLRTLQMPQQCTSVTKDLHSRYFRADDFATSTNPMLDTDLYVLLNALTRITGEEKYRAASDAALKYFFEHCQSPVTGLFAWGEHLGWDLIEDRITVAYGDKVSDTHEFYGPWVHWPQSFQVAPEACHRYSLGLWRHQILDQETCAFSRHAHWSKHGPGKGYEFARDAGFYIAAWSAAYEATRDEELLRAIRQMVAAYRRWRIPETGLLPLESMSPQVVFVLNHLSFTVDLGDSSARLPQDLGDDLRRFAAELDDALLRIEHDLRPDGHGFAKIVDGKTREVTNRVMAESPGRKAYFEQKPGLLASRYFPYGGLWGSSYGAGAYTDARHALLCARRFRQTNRPEYRKLVLATADRYLAAPPPADEIITPKTLAPPLSLLNAAYRLSSDRKYLEGSERLAEFARKSLFEPGVAFPYVTSRRQATPYYLAQSHPASLVLGMLGGWLLASGKESDLVLECNLR